jgi:transcriptional regulator with XRE-family HTH domain
MPLPTPHRVIGGERELARRIQWERERRDWTLEELASKMTSVGCQIQRSGIYKIEKGDPPRRIVVDELIALSKVFSIPVEQLLLPVELLEKERATEIARELPAAFAAYEDSIINGLRLYYEYGQLAQRSDDLRDFMNFRAERTWERPEPESGLSGVDLGPGVTDDDITEFRREVVEMWGRTLRLASKAARGGEA